MEKKGGLLYIVLVMTALMVMCWSGNTIARQNSLTGGIGAGYHYGERSYDNEEEILEDDLGDRRDYLLWPEFEFETSGIHDSLLLRYSPVVRYDDLESETDIDQYLDLNWLTQINRKWSFELTDQFVFSSDPTRYEGPFGTVAEEAPLEDPTDELIGADGLSQNLSTRRYWTNLLSMSTIYSYAAESNAEFGYEYRVLRNDSGGDELIEYDEYDRHGVTALWSHRYSPTWSSEFDLGYIKGDFDDPGVEELSQDLQEYLVDLELRYSKNMNNSFPIGYRFQSIDYEDLRDDAWGNELTFSWDYVLDSRNHFIVGAGPSYAKTDDLSGEFDYNVYANYIRSYQHGTVEALIAKSYLPRSFSGIGDTGLVDVTDVRVDINYEMSPNVTFDGFALYRYEEILNPDGEYYIAALGNGDPALESDIGDVTYTRDAYSVGAGINYTFWRWYTASAGYIFYKQDGDLSIDSYEDHRVLLTLTATTTLWR